MHQAAILRNIPAEEATPESVIKGVITPSAAAVTLRLSLLVKERRKEEIDMTANVCVCQTSRTTNRTFKCSPASPPQPVCVLQAAEDQNIERVCDLIASSINPAQLFLASLKSRSFGEVGGLTLTLVCSQSHGTLLPRSRCYKHCLSDTA